MARRKVFISYRRADTLHAVARIKSKVEARYADADVFTDIDAMPVGVPFDAHVRNQIKGATVVLAVIGSAWAGDVGARRRIREPLDVVRLELSTALAAGIPIVPITIDDAPYPMHDELPEDIKALSRHAGISIRGTSFESDAELLLDKLEPLIRPDAIEIGIGRRAERLQQWLVPGRGQQDIFSDFDSGPEMVVVPAGAFVMGSPAHEVGREPVNKGSEQQVREVLPRPYAIGRTVVTVRQFRKFVDETGHQCGEGASRWSERANNYRKDGRASWRDLAEDFPVVALSWTDAQAYVGWASRKTGWTYRLPTCAEWEYAARAGSTTAFHWGNSISPTQANYDARKAYRGGGDRGTESDGVVPAMHFEPNTWGLYQVHGNVWEMCSDTWSDGRRKCCGGGYEDPADELRSAMRSDVGGAERYTSVGFRVVRMLD